MPDDSTPTNPPAHAGGSNDADSAVAANQAGLALLDDGKPTEALAALREAERIERAARGDDHPRTRRRVFHVAQVLERMGDRTGAVAGYATVLGVRIRTLGPGADDTASVARSLRAAGGDPVGLARQIAGDAAADELRDRLEE